jgi:hypothetical protein
MCAVRFQLGAQMYLNGVGYPYYVHKVREYSVSLEMRYAQLSAHLYGAWWYLLKKDARAGQSCLHLKLVSGKNQMSPAYECLHKEVSLVQWLRLAFSKGPNRVGVSFPSPENGNRSSIRNVVFSSTYLQFRTMDKVQKPRNSVYYVYNLLTIACWFLTICSLAENPSPFLRITVCRNSNHISTQPLVYVTLSSESPYLRWDTGNVLTPLQ